MTGTSRRDFIKFIALVAAGAAARPEQIEAFEAYYEANTPIADDLIPDNLVAVDEIFLSGTAIRSMPILCEFYRNDHTVLKWGLNIYGGIIHWIAAPDQKIIAGAADFYWRIRSATDDLLDFSTVNGQISYVGQDKVRKYIQITKPEGSLIDA